jgi:hypothetical protein
MTPDEARASISKACVGREELDALAREALRAVRGWLARPSKQLDPKLFVLGKDGPDDAGKVILVRLPDWETDDEEVRIFRLAGVKFRDAGLMPVAAVAAHEVWIAEPAAGDNRRPRDRPDRKEAVIIDGAALGVREEGLYQAHAAVGLLYISRDRRGRIVPGAFEEAAAGGRAYLLEDFFMGYVTAMTEKHPPSRN